MKRSGREKARACGQSMVEFVFALPLLLLSVFAIVYFGRAFYISQALSWAAQEGARVAARVPNLRDAATRDLVRGFALGGQGTNPDSVIYSCLGGARLLSAGSAGNLPAQARVKILPWDSDGSPEDYTPPGTIAVRIQYPYQLLGDPFAGGEGAELAVAMTAEEQDPPVRFANFTISERATVAQEVYQEVN